MPTIADIPVAAQTEGAMPQRTLASLKCAYRKETRTVDNWNRVSACLKFGVFRNDLPLAISSKSFNGPSYILDQLCLLVSRIWGFYIQKIAFISIGNTYEYFDLNILLLVSRQEILKDKCSLYSLFSCHRKYA